MKNKIYRILKSIYKISIYTFVIAIIFAAILAVGYFLIPYIVKEHKEPKNFSVVLQDKIYESGLPKDKELEYVVKKYGIRSIDALMVIYRIGCLKWEFDDAISEAKNHYSDKQKEIIPSIKSAVRYNKTTSNYYVDKKKYTVYNNRSLY
ncbi:MAG: hypothetical protein DRI44_05065 [Chlamydiae bacterium]|nr:MAG: hypothetical protein DRI44_05065 [Chlamydiota bacterium]